MYRNRCRNRGCGRTQDLQARFTGKIYKTRLTGPKLYMALISYIAFTMLSVIFLASPSSIMVLSR